MDRGDSISRPLVLIDGELLHTVRSLTFDYEAFYTLASGAGLTGKQIAAYTIYLTNGVHPGLAGRYLPRARRAEIYVGGILAEQPEHIDKLLLGEELLPLGEQYSRVLSRVVAHETGHHSPAGRFRGKLATLGTSVLFAMPLLAAGIGMFATAVTGALLVPLAAFLAEVAATVGLSYRRASVYSRPTAGNLFAYHRSRFSEKPAFALEARAPTTPLITIHLK
jgi:hypothetical protein